MREKTKAQPEAKKDMLHNDGQNCVPSESADVMIDDKDLYGTSAKQLSANYLLQNSIEQQQDDIPIPASEDQEILHISSTQVNSMAIIKTRLPQ
ncbi:hypothetical protein WAI453_007946 [Rhynchosporium graminicola]